MRCNHGMTNHILYPTWVGMIGRTNNPNTTHYEKYGGRGIIVCDRWKDIHNFINDMYPTYQKGLTLDRINNDGNYEPSNCRWATQAIQSRNTSKIMATNTSGYRGVSFAKHANKWVTKIRVDRIKIHVGYFYTALEAAQAYDNYIIENNLDHTTNGIFNEAKSMVDNITLIDLV